ncbi:uncharacterized protein B0H64DRAFT_153115 [Chaetomium fimeti]|uniref:DUF4211 domain-containing protein n=1 Tax=Chaetomium fimeti TaxID=1854472 RepID=A0AAE0HG76_9PEZI|nr:hypothetical protein B0H64DRAFT_153115 [Chaetomium fimeti]
MVRPRKKKQQTLEATLGRPRVKTIIRPRGKRKDKAASGTSVLSSPPRNAAPLDSSPPAPPSSFMHSSQVPGSTRKKTVAFEDSSSEEAREDEQERVFPVRGTRRGKGRPVAGPGWESDSESESSILSSGKGEKAREESDDQEDDDDEPLATPIARRKRHLAPSESDEDEQPLVSPPIKRRRLIRRKNTISSQEDKEDEDEEEPPAPSSVKTGRARRKPLTLKEKARELLRRKRAGEVINEDENSSSSDEEEPVKAMYDSDPDHLVLDEFEDDEEGINEPVLEDSATERRKSKKGKKKQKRNVVDGDDGSESLDDFVIDDDDAPLGVPDEAYQDMPLEFTRHSQKSLKEYFRDAIEWLVQFMVNPEFPKEHAVYHMAWKKLDDEVQGLATSKFASAAWKKEFIMALRARPYFNNVELSKGDMAEVQHCGACGRTGHPAKYLMTFTGAPYYKNITNLERFLQPVDMDSESDSGSGSNAHDDDENGNSIPKEDTEWFVGAVCNSNAETTHDLMHWKKGLLVFVDTRLHIEGYMDSAKVVERERMDPQERNDLVDKIMNHWEKNGMVKALYQEFKGTIEKARNKPTSGRYR